MTTAHADTFTNRQGTRFVALTRQTVDQYASAYPHLAADLRARGWASVGECRRENGRKVYSYYASANGQYEVMDVYGNTVVR